MKAKSMILIVIALGCGLVASIGISQVMDRDTAPAPVVQTDQIFVAMTDIDIKEQLTAENVKLEAWPTDRIPPGAIRSFDEIERRFAKTRLYAGEPIMAKKLASSIDGDVSTVIPPGFRVVTVKVSIDSGLASLVAPGDRVDIMAFIRRSSEVPKTTTKAVLRNVRVFAVDAETERQVDSSGNTIMAKTVSVLVKQDQVPRLMLAYELGALKLSLRNPSDETEESNVDEFTVDELFAEKGESADDAPSLGNPAPPNGGGILSLLDSATPALDQSQPKVEWEMVQMSPAGTLLFQWDQRDQLPRAVAPGGVSSPSASPTLPLLQSAEPKDAAPQSGNEPATTEQMTEDSLLED